MMVFKSARRLVLSLLAVLTLVGGCSALDEQQRRWVFQPSRATWGGAMSMDGMHDVWLDVDSKVDAKPVRLHALWMPQQNAAAPLVLYLHGARWNVESSAGRIRRLHDLGFSVLGIDYRGFGQSTDILPSETSVQEDARAGWDWLAQQHPGVPRYLFGHSLGSAIAVQLAVGLDTAADASQRAAGLMLEGAFTSVPAVAATFKWGWLPFSMLVTQRFDSASRIGALKTPVLFVHGSRDGLIAPELGHALYDKAPQPKRFVLVDGGTHHNAGTVGLDDARKAMGELFGWGVPPAPLPGRTLEPLMESASASMGATTAVR